MCFLLMGGEVEDLGANKFFNIISPVNALGIDTDLEILHEIEIFQKERHIKKPVWKIQFF